MPGVSASPGRERSRDRNDNILVAGHVSVSVLKLGTTPAVFVEAQVINTWSGDGHPASYKARLGAEACISLCRRLRRDRASSEINGAEMVIRWGRISFCPGHCSVKVDADRTKLCHCDSAGYRFQ